MSYCQWTENFAINIDKIDSQHKKIILMLNRLLDAIFQGIERKISINILEELMQYTTQHFADEEQYMKIYNYPNYEEHIKLHAQLTKIVCDYKSKIKKVKKDEQTEIVIELFELLKYWLMNHITVVDKEFGNYLQCKGL